jgi:hypothetical protein
VTTHRRAITAATAPRAGRLARAAVIRASRAKSQREDHEAALDSGGGTGKNSKWRDQSVPQVKNIPRERRWFFL